LNCLQTSKVCSTGPDGRRSNGSSGGSKVCEWVWGRVGVCKGSRLKVLILCDPTAAAGIEQTCKNGRIQGPRCLHPQVTRIRIRRRLQSERAVPDFLFSTRYLILPLLFPFPFPFPFLLLSYSISPRNVIYDI